MSAAAPPRSAAARGLRLGRAVAQAGAVQALGRLGVGRGDAAAAQVLLRALLELRGAALKVAQFLCLEHDVLTPEVLSALAQASHRVPPMGPEFARSLLQRALGSQAQQLADFDPVPFAAASLGQVHAATGHDGQALAVKIQYPGMAQTVRSDLSLLHRVATVLPQAALGAHVLDEIQARLLEECDYLQEAAAQAWFAEHLRVDGVTVPRPLPALSNRHLITSVRLRGHHFDAWLHGAPPHALRDRAAQALFDAFVQSLRRLGRLHGDPQPGNVLFQDDGGVALLDFGCTRWLPPDVQQMVPRLLRAAVHGDDAAAHAVYRAMGVLDAVPAAEASLRPFREWIALPLREPCFDFGADPAFVAEGRRRFVRLWQDALLAGLRPEFVLINRTLYGLYRLFERLGARVRCQALWADDSEPSETAGAGA